MTRRRRDFLQSSEVIQVQLAAMWTHVLLTGAANPHQGADAGKSAQKVDV